MLNPRVFFLKARMRLFPRLSGKYDFNEILKNEGIEVGKGTIFYNPNSMEIDRERPWMLRIGEYCKIASGAVILTHDYSRSVLRRKYGDIVGEAGQTIIGNNVFIGINSIILMGCHIGDNVIIGAGSVVASSIPENCVAAGNPCRVICSLDDFYKKRKELCVDEAKEYYLTFRNKYGRRPKIKEMGPFFPLFMQHREEALRREKININLSGDEEKEILSSFVGTKALFSSYEQFEQFCYESEV